MKMRNESNPGQRVRSIFARLFAPVLTVAVCAMPQVAHAAAIYVANANGFGAGAPGTVGQYNLSGTAVNSSPITGLNQPLAIAVVPEPASLALIGVMGAMMLRRRSKMSSAI